MSKKSCKNGELFLNIQYTGTKSVKRNTRFVLGVAIFSRYIKLLEK